MNEGPAAPPAAPWPRSWWPYLVCVLIISAVPLSLTLLADRYGLLNQSGSLTTLLETLLDIFLGPPMLVVLLVVMGSGLGGVMGEWLMIALCAVVAGTYYGVFFVWLAPLSWFTRRRWLRPVLGVLAFLGHSGMVAFFHYVRMNLD